MYFEPSPILVSPRLVYTDDILAYDSGKDLSENIDNIENTVEESDIEENLKELSLEEFSDVEISPVSSEYIIDNDMYKIHINKFSCSLQQLGCFLPQKNIIIRKILSFTSITGYSIYAIITGFLIKIPFDVFLIILSGLYFSFIMVSKLYHRDALTLCLPWKDMRICVLVASIEILECLLRMISLTYLPFGLSAAITCCSPLIVSIVGVNITSSKSSSENILAQLGIIGIFTFGLIIHLFGTVRWLNVKFLYLIFGIVTSTGAFICHVIVNGIIEYNREKQIYCTSHWFLPRCFLIFTLGIIISVLFNEDTEFHCIESVASASGLALLYFISILAIIMN